MHYTSEFNKVNWYFNDNPVFKENKKIEVNSSHYQEKRERNASYLTIINVTESHRGWYFCEVIQDIPQLDKTQSNGAELIVGKYCYIHFMYKIHDSKNKTQLEVTV